MTKKETVSQRLERLEAHLSVVSLERVKQIEDKLKIVSTDVKQNVKPCLEENSERITRLESVLGDKEKVEQQTVPNHQVISYYNHTL